jgi:hypothetical protein
MEKVPTKIIDLNQSALGSVKAQVMHGIDDKYKSLFG